MRIQPMEVLEAYSAIGAKPARCSFVGVADNGEVQCCALGVLYLASRFENHTGEPLRFDADEADELNWRAAHWADGKFDPSFCAWFGGAFDGAVTDEMVARITGIALEGAVNGRAVALAVFGVKGGAR